MKTTLKKQRGITLIALVITMIILIILAGVAISMLAGDNGILKQAAQAKEKMAKAQEKEKRTLASYEAATNLENTEYKYTNKDGEEKIVTIPAGFTVSPIEDEQDPNTGLVIIDASGNEYVWVPVDNPTDMYSEGEYEILSGANKTKYYSKLYDYTSKGRTLITSIPTTSGQESYREPGYLSAYDNQYYEQAGYSSSVNMINSFIADYNDMIESVKKYGGFYIGRYELSGTVENPTVQAGNTPMTDENWYKLNLACRNLTTSDAVTSTMIWDTQWDATMKWLQDSGIDVENSGDYGNYLDTAFEYTEEDGTTNTKYRMEYYDDRYNIIDANDKVCYYYIITSRHDSEAGYDFPIVTFYKEDGTKLLTWYEEGFKCVIGDVTYYWNSEKNGYFNGEEGFVVPTYGSLAEDWLCIYGIEGKTVSWCCKLPTGVSEHNKTNNVYDLAGNVCEFTQGVDDKYSHTIRSGDYELNAYNNGMAERSSFSAGKGLESIRN